MTCPHCEQGVIHRLYVASTGGAVLYCDECDLLWLRAADIGSTAESTVTAYVEAHDVIWTDEDSDEIYSGSTPR